MALSKSSKILVSDINTALSNKQDKLSYTPVKSVNGTQADSSGNVAISVSAPVTSVNGMTGAVTISSVNTAYITPNACVKNVGDYDRNTWTIPAGGTWAVLYWDTNISDFHGITKYASGGTTFSAGTYLNGIAIRIA